MAKFTFHITPFRLTIPAHAMHKKGGILTPQGKKYPFTKKHKRSVPRRLFVHGCVQSNALGYCYGFHLTAMLRLCFSCNACEVVCKQEHNLPIDPRWIRVYPDGPREIEGKSQMRYVVTQCMHCSRPRCMDACPIGAISKRGDGIVLVNEELCIGCKDCIDACPLGVMQFNEEKEVA